ncbi:MAG: ribonuclease HI [Patescibacteria group bacterium]
MSQNIEIYTDGSSLGNPGPGGWGAVITLDGQILKELGACEEKTTNNRMELAAVIGALEYVLKNHKEDNVIIHADSSYVLGGITTWIHNWEKNGWKTASKGQVLNQDLWQKLIALVREFGPALSWQKVKGHAGVLHNERADEIATTCASLQQSYAL